MYISDVSGHCNAALAVEKAVRIFKPDTEILNINAFNYTNPLAEKITNSIYMGIIKIAPKIWDYLYDNPEIVRRIERTKENIHKANSPKLKKLFDKFLPDAVICTQAFPCGMVADYKKTYGVNLPLVAVLTDYVPHSYWIYDSVDYYIVPSEDIARSLIKKGVNAKRVKPLGIPFDPKFSQKLDKENLFNKYKLNPAIPTVLIMGGGHGLGPIKTICRSLERVKPDIQEIIVTGVNKKLYKSLRRRIKKYAKKILLFGYTQHINELMELADIVISKPGGVTISEVLSKGKPMIIVKPLPGQEANNTRYLTGAGAAIKIDKPKDIYLVIEDLIRNSHKLERIKEAAVKIANPNASLDIARFILKGLEGND
ncbi:MAG: UDP-N-acetylglucosamine--LPS N-acetylglucosamine transferase [Candidatus Omnitrophica bacterium]|nr:UDP-N-acetylglucosamine--LPS N-acetylglucosamine transferase [Candidatus Omnitrophota bacterium]